jgi:hypothetical protein
MRKYLVYCFFAILSIGLGSCSDSDPQPVVALKSVTVVPFDNAVGYSCIGNYNSQELTNTDDKVPMDVTSSELQKATLTANTTLGIGVEAYYNGQVIGADGVTVDATKPIQVEVHGYNQVKAYTINVLQATEMSADELVIAKSTDMKKMGIDANVVDYSVAYFNNKFYCFTSGLNGTVAQYKLYSSDNGLKWSEVTYAPHDLGAVGGLGAKALAFNNRLYSLGGARTLGTDEWGVAPETDWGMATISWWRSFSTADGQSFKCDTVGVAGKWTTSWGSTSNSNLPKASTFPNAITYNNRIYIKNAYSVAYGSLSPNSSYLYSEDGVNWTKIPSVTDVTNRRQDAFFAFNGKLWCLGGFKSYISTSKDNSMVSIYSSSDGGTTWTLEADDAGIGKMWGMTPVCGDHSVYLVGGEYIEDGKRVLSDKIYRSTDCIHWEAIKTGSKYTARRSPQVVVKDSYAYIFGGYNTVSKGNYGYDLTTHPAFDTFMFELK